MEKLRYKKINEIINTLNEREKKYILKKIQKELEKVEVQHLDFTINNKIHVIV